MLLLRVPSSKQISGPNSAIRRNVSALKGVKPGYLGSSSNPKGKKRDEILIEYPQEIKNHHPSSFIHVSCHLKWGCEAAGNQHESVGLSEKRPLILIRFSLNDCFSVLLPNRFEPLGCFCTVWHVKKWKGQTPVTFHLRGLREVGRNLSHSPQLSVWGIRTSNSTREALVLVFPAGQVCHQPAVCCLHRRRHRSQEVTALVFSHSPPLKAKTAPVWAVSHICHHVQFPDRITIIIALTDF